MSYEIKGNNDGYYVATPKGNKIYPSVGVTSLQECKRWVAENTREAEPVKDEVDPLTKAESEWCEFQILLAARRLRELEPEHDLVTALSSALAQRQR